MTLLARLVRDRVALVGCPSANVGIGLYPSLEARVAQRSGCALRYLSTGAQSRSEFERTTAVYPVSG